MPQQPSLFYDSIYDALREVVRAAGGPKAVGALLWPGKSVQEAQTRLLNCLDHNRSEKLSPEDLIVLLKVGRRDAQCHVAMQFLCSECGYEDPQPIEPTDELAALQRTFIDSVLTQKTLIDRMERLTNAPLAKFAHVGEQITSSAQSRPRRDRPG